MIIEIRKAGFVNKGAELMLYAVLEKMRERYPEAKFAMAPSVSSASAPFQKRAELGFYQKAQLWRKGFQFGVFANLIPAKIRDMYGIVLNSEIDIVIDAAGFSYSDQWGMSSSLELADSCKRWKKKGAKVILMPQAFGPFTKTIIKKAIQAAADHADLIFARERISYEHLVGVTGERSNIKMAPDFTNLISGFLPDDFDQIRCRFCLVPNYRMIDKTSKEQSEAYLPFMIRCAKYLQEKEQQPFILVHEGANDLMLAGKIRDAVGGELPIVREDHPLKIKGILGVCEGTIGSRFHGLVSALSQGVPSLATGWSHKYKMLFEDYGFGEGLMDVTMPENQIKEKIDLIIQPQSRSEIKKKINSRSGELKQQSEKMWEDVFTALGR